MPSTAADTDLSTVAVAVHVFRNQRTRLLLPKLFIDWHDRRIGSDQPVYAVRVYIEDTTDQQTQTQIQNNDNGVQQNSDKDRRVGSKTNSHNDQRNQVESGN